MAFCFLISSTKSRKNNLTQDCEDCHSQQFECRGSYSRLTITQIECLVDMFVIEISSLICLEMQKRSEAHAVCMVNTQEDCLSCQAASEFEIYISALNVNVLSQSRYHKNP